MSNNILPNFKQNLIREFMASINSPITNIKIKTGGSEYANGEALVFTGLGTPAGGIVVTSNTGAVQYIALANNGNYADTPNVTINTVSGYGASLEAEIDNDNYYLFVGRSQPYLVETSPEPNYKNDYDADFFQHEQMYFGIRLNEDAVAYMVKRNNWTSGVVYSQYDDKDHEQPDSAFYVITLNNSVYKCIDNNNGAPSIIEPTSTQTSGLPTETSDGYRWMFLYSLTGQNMTRFATQNFIPIIENTDVTSGAISGGIFNIKVVSGGTQYPVSTGIVQNTGDRSITIIGATSKQNYYANCTITVFSETNLVTNLKINSSVANGSTVILTTANSFNANQVSYGYNFSIAPSLVVLGDGSGLDGYFTVNEISQSIVDVHIIAAGSGYNKAQAQAISGTGFGNGSVLVPIISPSGGHGSDVFSELYSESIGITGEFSNTNGFSEDVTIRTVGLMQNPTANNGILYRGNSFSQLVTLNAANTSPNTFTPGETIVGNISGARGTVTSSNSSSIIITGYIGSFISGEIINGAISKNQYTLSSVVNKSDLDVYSGDVLYIQNINPSPRDASSSEQIKLILKL